MSSSGKQPRAKKEKVCDISDESVGKSTHTRTRTKSRSASKPPSTVRNSVTPPTSKTSKGITLLRDEAAPSKWRNAIIRLFYSILMVAAFAGITWIGHSALCILIFLLQTIIYCEVIAVGVPAVERAKLPLSRFLHWYFFIVTEYFLYGELLISRFLPDIVGHSRLLLCLVSHHLFISFSLYSFGFVCFVLSLRKGSYELQFSQFSWTHMALFLVLFQSHLFVSNIFDGVFWFLLPSLLVVCNDIMAYIFGFFFGKTPLIGLSPKKTWEGFLGALVSTVIFGWFMTGFMAKFSYMHCPVTKLSQAAFAAPTVHCSTPAAFMLTKYDVPSEILEFVRTILTFAVQKGFLSYGSKAIAVRWLASQTILAYPIQFHSIALSLFSSLVAPFGGFFASGLKRAVGVKDFGNFIPGHGGATDRMDCQIIMATFAYVYLHTFINPDVILPLVSARS